MEYKPPPPHLRCAEVTEGGTGPGIKTGLGSDGQVVRPPVMGGHLGSWMATKDPSSNAAENDFPIEI